MLDDGGLPLERYQRYHEEKARGGLAMTMVGGSAMTSPDSSWGGGQLDLSSDRIVPHLQLCRSHPSPRRCRHVPGLASRTPGDRLRGNWLPVLAPSRIRETRNRNFPKEMDEADIARIVKDYADAALRCVRGGMDGIETVTGGHLIGQFLSPRTNKRTDRFGGSPENRARFGLMVHEALRKAVGDNAVIGIRFVIDEGIADGSNFEDCLELARIFEREGHIDYFNCIYGRMDTDLALAEDNMPGMFQPSAPFLDKVRAFRRETKLPLIHAAGIRDVATARHAIREGIVDLVGMTRAHIADPNIVNKIMRNEEERIRPCVGASYCLYKKVNCIHNAASGRETALGHTVERAPRALKAVVIGGGPAGLEAARVCAERGHSVVLFEAAARLGGQLLVATAAAERRDLIGIVDWRVGELERLGVDIRTNCYAETDAVLAEKPDLVIVATGGVPDTDWFEGAELCNSVWDVLSGTVQGKNDVLVYDGTGRQAAASCALHLSQLGKSVCIATPDDALALEMTYIDKSSFRKRMTELGIRSVVEVGLEKVDRRGNRLLATLRNELTGAQSQIEADQIIVEHGTVPVADVYHALRHRSANDGVTDIALVLGQAEAATPPTGAFQLHRIGDAVSSRDIYSSIHEAYRLCSKL